MHNLWRFVSFAAVVFVFPGLLAVPTATLSGGQAGSSGQTMPLDSVILGHVVSPTSPGLGAGSDSRPPDCLVIVGPICPAVSDNGWIRFSVPVSPSPRYGAMMAYDAADNYTVLFGGFDGSTPPYRDLNDTWTFRSGVWSELHPVVSPSARTLGAMATDPVTGCPVLFGGDGNPSGNDTWTFCHGQWHQVVTLVHPSGRSGAGFASDPPCGCLLLFGGGNQTTISLADTWEYTRGAWTRLNLTPSPPGRSDMQMAYDYSSQSVILFSGDGNVVTNDTWTFQDGAWSELHPPASPTWRIHGSLTSCPLGGGPVLFGGYYAFNDTWVFSSGNWENTTGANGRLPENGPRARVTWLIPRSCCSGVSTIG